MSQPFHIGDDAIVSVSGTWNPRGLEDGVSFMAWYFAAIILVPLVLGSVLLAVLWVGERAADALNWLQE
jgi:succinate dehydrogenase hydrophobic anchor subunit